MLAYLKVEKGCGEAGILRASCAPPTTSIIHLMLVGGGGDRCWTSWATCIADFELARADKPKFSKGRATPAGYARMLAALASRARARASGICGISQNEVYLSLR